jgi:hypothetical protein
MQKKTFHPRLGPGRMLHPALHELMKESDLQRPPGWTREKALLAFLYPNDLYKAVPRFRHAFWSIQQGLDIQVLHCVE